MTGEGFKLSVILILGFFLLSAGSMGMIALGKTDVTTLAALYTALGTMAAMLGFPAILGAYIVTRGQTSQLCESPKV
jgi:hypothetical protein